MCEVNVVSSPNKKLKIIWHSALKLWWWIVAVLFKMISPNCFVLLNIGGACCTTHVFHIFFILVKPFSESLFLNLVTIYSFMFAVLFMKIFFCLLVNSIFSWSPFIPVFLWIIKLKPMIIYDLYIIYATMKLSKLISEWTLFSKFVHPREVRLALLHIGSLDLIYT